MESKSNIFEKTKHIDPEYQHLSKYIDIMWKGFWTPAKYQKNIDKIDAPHVLNRMSGVDAEAVKRAVLAISLVEDKVKTFWASLVFDIPQTIIGEIGGVFSNSETVHSQSYRALAESLKIQDRFESIMKIPVMKGRSNYLQKYLESDHRFRGKKRVLKKLVLFTALVERASLFSQFYILMSFANANKGLKTISSLQASTMLEEIQHFNFGVDLINIIKAQHPRLWDDALQRLVKKDVKAAYKKEIKLIDWIFENGVPDHLTKEEVINFLNFNFNVISQELDLGISFDVDERLYEEKNSFIDLAIRPSEPDFFDSPVGGYSSIEEDFSDEDLDDIFN